MPEYSNLFVVLMGLGTVFAGTSVHHTAGHADELGLQPHCRAQAAPPGRSRPYSPAGMPRHLAPSPPR